MHSTTTNGVGAEPPVSPRLHQKALTKVTRGPLLISLTTVGGKRYVAAKAYHPL